MSVYSGRQFFWEGVGLLSEFYSMVLNMVLCQAISCYMYFGHLPITISYT